MLTSSNRDAVIRVENVSKRYRLGAGQYSLREAIYALPRLLAGRNHQGAEVNKHVWALKDVTFEVKKGEVLGIIGPNGAGKSTILKLLSQVTRPTHGQIHVGGRISALIELGAGFHPDLTGRENVYLNGAIMGLSQKDIRQRFDDIVAFAELERFIDTPVKRYSSGMYARLGFSIAVHTDPEVLLVDEVLSVGDVAFQRRSFERMQQMCKQGLTLVFVSHNLQAVGALCDRVILLNKGRVSLQGTPQEAIDGYFAAMSGQGETDNGTDRFRDGIRDRIIKGGAKILSVRLVDDQGVERNLVRPGEEVKVCFTTLFEVDAFDPIIACFIRTANGLLVYDINNDWMRISTGHFRGGETYTWTWRLKLSLLEGAYALGGNIALNDLSGYYDSIENAVSFYVQSTGQSKGIADLKGQLLLHYEVGERKAWEPRLG